MRKIGIENTKKVYDKVLTKSDRQILADLTGISDKEILELTK